MKSLGLNGDRSENCVDLSGYFVVALFRLDRTLVSGHEISGACWFFGMTERGVDDDRREPGMEQFFPFLLLPVALGQIGKLAR
jgi:hypothetical protein